MGTNYYFHERPPCLSCHRPFEGRHIGKSSYGWVFQLRVYPDEGIDSLDVWTARLKKENSIILDEYGESVPIDQMLSVIQNRASPAQEPAMEDRDHKEYFWDASEKLFRMRIGKYCLGHGKSWDLAPHEFS